MYVLVLELVCVNAVDLVIVLDLAGTAPTTADFTTYKNFVSNFIRNFDHSSTAVQIGLIVAGDGVATNVFYLDTYIGNELAFNPRGAVALGYYLAGPRLVIDRLDGMLGVLPALLRPATWGENPGFPYCFRMGEQRQLATWLVRRRATRARP